MNCEECANWRRCARKGAGMLDCRGYVPKRRKSGTRTAVVRPVGREMGEKVYRVEIYSGSVMTGAVTVRDTLAGVKRFVRDDLGIGDVTIGESLVDAMKAEAEERKAREKEEMWGHHQGVPWWEDER